MRLVIATCSVDYVGRLTAHLPMAPRLLLVKADGSVSVHADDRAYKPLNWMSPPCQLREEPDRWVVANKAGEQLIITIAEISHDSRHELGADPGLVKDGVEAHLQALLAEQVHLVGPDLRLVRREFATPIGPVDLFCRTAAAVPVELADASAEPAAGEQADVVTDLPVVRGRGPRHVAVEVKRRATLEAVEQLTRYLDFLNRDALLAPVAGVLAAQSIVPQARTLAEDRGIRCVVLDYDAMRGVDVDGVLF